MSAPALKPCPWCNGHETVEVDLVAEITDCDQCREELEDAFGVVCNVHKGGCGASGPAGAYRNASREQAIAAWNRRPPGPEAPEGAREWVGAHLEDFATGSESDAEDFAIAAHLAGQRAVSEAPHGAQEAATLYLRDLLEFRYGLEWAQREHQFYATDVEAAYLAGQRAGGAPEKNPLLRGIQERWEGAALVLDDSLPKREVRMSTWTKRWVFPAPPEEAPNG